MTALLTYASATERMKTALLDIIDVCNTDACTWRADTTNKDWENLVRKIDSIAHLGLYDQG